MKIHTYQRKTFIVEAVQVTADNLREAAQWCEGGLHIPADGPAFVKVRVHRPLSERQTRAFVGDWILKTKNSFKVYPEKAFKSSFEEVGESHLEKGGQWPTNHEEAMKVVHGQ